MHSKCPHLILSLLGGSLIALAQTSSAAAADGFIGGSHLDLLNRNYYFNHDNHKTNGRDGREWGHALMANFSSGYTPGLVGFGLDAHAYATFKLDSGRGRNRTDLFAPEHDGSSSDSAGSAGGALKMRISATELKYGNLRPYNPVFAMADVRLVPATATGFMLVSREIEQVELEAGHFTSGKDYNRTHSDGGFYAAYAGLEGGNVDYLGGSFALGEQLSLMLYTSKYADLWRQHYGNLNYNLPLAAEQSLNVDFNLYRSREQGKALAGDIDISAWSLGTAYKVGAHTFSLGYQKIDGDQPFDYLLLSGGGYQDSIYLGNASQYADFNGPNEQSWRIGYDLDLALFGIPGASIGIRHVRGSDIDGTKLDRSSAYYGFYGKDEKHNTTDLDLRYVVQSGAAKDLMIRVRHAHHRMTSGNSDADVDRFRVVIEYPLNIF